MKSSDHSIGPGPNLFSDSPENVWVDDNGKLHLRISYRDGRWWCAEVICTSSFGLGSYTYAVEGDVSDLDANAILGFFTWSDDPEAAHREIDIEISRWGQSTNSNVQFALQPWELPQHIFRFDLPPLDGSRHQFRWGANSVYFESQGLDGEFNRSYGLPVSPPPGSETPRINLWLLAGNDPLRGQDVHVVIERFEFHK